ncbi:hypothetical protein ORD22_14650 [Sporosarcina sp. GW1-11]|uniref:hypothetical protein n=1 Tax=Sporosarcina sp. GW1-11 TaxID=2899126 RepID=UPI00294BCAAB|nr:hypothetical protein [Sporosarcina sp. GW1-11]MDV6379453.1 hypothetical protein [Sporosarcina sp. GW1-11]
MQVENSRHYLQRWLAEQNIKIPIQCAVVLANQKTSVHEAPTEMQWLYAKHLPLFFHSQPPKDPILTPKQLDTLIQRLTEQQTLYNPSPLKNYYHIEEHMLRTGCLCNLCNAPLQKVSERKWRCVHCDRFEKSAIRQATQDYFLIFETELSNKQCREYLGVNQDAACYVLKNLPLLKVGFILLRQTTIT